MLVFLIANWTGKSSRLNGYKSNNLGSVLTQGRRVHIVDRESIQGVRFPKTPSAKAWLTTHAVTLELLELMMEFELGKEWERS